MQSYVKMGPHFLFLSPPGVPVYWSSLTLKLLKLACMHSSGVLIAFVLVCLTSPFIHCYWYLVAVKWSVRNAFFVQLFVKLQTF